MWDGVSDLITDDNLYLPGRPVGSGVYRQIGGFREVRIDQAGDTLPASLDGRVAGYTRIDNMWGLRA